ncbi:MAG: hypothetical protein AABY13_04760 [Nanoarchaeota archaeon]
MEPTDALVVFEGKNIRRVWHNDQWFFIVTDVIQALTDTSNPSDYLKKMRGRDAALAEGWGQIVTSLVFVESGKRASIF